MNHYYYYEPHLQIEKISNWSILWQFIPKTRAGAHILTRVQSPKSQHLVCEHLCSIVHNSWAVFNHIYLLQIERISNWSDFMSIHSHLYLKSGLGPGVDPKSPVERPLKVETWPKLIFTTFSNIFDWNRPIIWKSYQWKVINHFWRISTRVQVWPDFDLVPTANFFSSNLSKSQINFPPFGEKRKSKAHFYQKIYKFTFSPVANFTVKNSWTSGY